MRIHGVLLQIFRQSTSLLGIGDIGEEKHCSCLNWSSRPFTTHPALKADAEMVDITFITPDGTRHKTKGKVGDNLLDVVVNNNVDLDGFGACEGTLACSTCHLVFKQEDFDKIKDEVTDEELDMLDLAYGLSETSRLGCQVTLTKELGGLEVEVPAGVNDARS
ncbi:Adrenodoxin, mitochondrial [Orchesella cincta]|uniref:Adrenodoxin, mitochondrial n=1 Tax=Orchesella cincta TaxID=48709 RepID=A0A1D2M844_ORCCI|nr:Adrenodoxin, mitochondrial [Orchesella cincta]